MLEAAERFELSSSEVEARRIRPLCYAASFFTTLVRDAGIEPASSRLKGECISLSANPAQNLVGDAGIEPAWSRLRGECISHLCQSPMLNKIGAGCWNRANTSRLSIAGSTFELILPGAPFGS